MMNEVQLKTLTMTSWAKYRTALDSYINLSTFVSTRIREDASSLELSELEALFHDVKEDRETQREAWHSTLNVLRLHGRTTAEFLGG